MRQLRRVTGKLERIVAFHRATDFSAAAVVKRPTAAFELMSAQIRSELAFEPLVELVGVMHHQNILGRNGAIGLQLEAPVPFSVLRAEKRARSTLYGVLELG